MDIAAIEQRILDLTKALEQTFANHSALTGRIDEAKFILEGLKKVSDVAQAVEVAIE